MTKEESNSLMSDPIFRGRVKVSALQFAGAIMIEDSSIPAHNARQRWATQTYQQPDQVASQLTPPVVMDPQVQLDGPNISDTALQTSVETVVNKVF